VFGMSGNITKTKVVAATVSQSNATAITMTYNGGQDSTTVTGINWTVGGATGPLMGSMSPSAAVLAVGTTATSLLGTAGQDHVVGTAYFMDGTQQVIIDTYV